MEAMDLFLRDHARVHSSKVGAQAGGFSLEEGLFEEINADDLRACPHGINSIAWQIWHMARSEDVAVNVVIVGKPQVFDRDGWAGKLGVRRRDIGTGMTREEAADVGRAVDLEAMRAYRIAVGLQTRSVVSQLTMASLAEPYGTEHRLRVENEEAIAADGQWLHRFWKGKSMDWFLTWMGVGHSYLHMGKAGLVKALLRPGTMP